MRYVQRGESLQRFAQRRSAAIDVDKDEPFQSLHVDLRQPEDRPVETGLAVHRRRTGQCAVQTVAPAVERATDQFAVPLTLQQRHRAVPADVG